MKLDRRNFLQQAGLALFSWGVAEAGLSSLDEQKRLPALIKNYRHTLAESTSRKLALLVGIDRYPHQENLKGCITDIELQKELLIHRFGFQSQNILTLKDRQATRENIETAFIEHLGKQAKAEDVVLFHFSGYGRQIKMPLTDVADSEEAEQAFKLVNSYVPADGVASSKDAIANNILQDTLLALAQSLSTAKCTFVLDTSFNTTPRSQHGNFKIRSTPEVATSLSSEETLFLEQLRSNFAAKRLKPTKRLNSLPGVVLSASSSNQIAAERRWDDFSAGLFTHALTQHLWQITPSNKIQVAVARTAATVEQVMGRQQQPTLNSPDKLAIAYYLATSDASPAMGVISKVSGSGSNVEIKLLGMSASLLDCYGVNSCLSVASAEEGSAPTQLQLQGQTGLVAKAKVLGGKTSNLRSGQPVTENIRMLKRDLGLNLALDGEMERIERVDATSALSNISGVNSAIVSEEQNTDCLIGKVDRLDRSHGDLEGDEHSEATTFYGLYTPGGVLIGKTSSIEDEAVKIAIARLQPQFKNLLAAKWLSLLSNEFTSRLEIAATITSEVSEQATGITSLTRSTASFTGQLPTGKKSLLASRNTPSLNSTVPSLNKGADLQLALVNNSPYKLYAMVLGRDADSNIFALYTPIQATTAEATAARLSNTEITPQAALEFPDSDHAWQWKASTTPGIDTLYTIFSVQPFNRTLETLAAPQSLQFDRTQVLNVVNPLEVVEALMVDLHAASSVNANLLPNHDVYALDVNKWASLSFVYEVTNG